MALHQQMKTWTHEQFDKFCAISDRFAAYGYWIYTEPLEGCFDIWIEKLWDGFNYLEKQADEARKVWGYRGLSKNLLAHLHSRHPEPCWGVEPRAAA